MLCKICKKFLKNYFCVYLFLPFKHEGDNKSPAGVFKLTTAFGFAATPDPQLKLSYTPITNNIVCVDDVKSQYYGKVIDQSRVTTKDWDSAENMVTIKEACQKGIVVDYNVDGKMLGGGSCIFIHVRRAGTIGTAGCTAMDLSKLSSILNWLNPDKNPVMVQLPKDQYQRLQKAWGLPVSVN